MERGGGGKKEGGKKVFQFCMVVMKNLDKWSLQKILDFLMLRFSLDIRWSSNL